MSFTHRVQVMIYCAKLEVIPTTYYSYVLRVLENFALRTRPIERIRYNYL